MSAHAISSLSLKFELKQDFGCRSSVVQKKPTGLQFTAHNLLDLESIVYGVGFLD